MSRTGARDRARRQLTESLMIMCDAVTLLGRSRKLTEQLGTQDAAQYLADLDALCSRPFPAQIDQHPDNQAIDQFAAAMKTKLAQARAEGRHCWSKPCAQDNQLAVLLVGRIPIGDPGDLEVGSRDHSIAKGVAVCPHHLDPRGNCFSEDELCPPIKASLNGQENETCNPRVWIIQFTQASS